MVGWIKIHRSLLEWEWFSDPKTVSLFLYCLLKANHENKRWMGKEIERGSFITSLSNLSLDTGLSVKEVRVRLDRLENSGEIGREKGKQWTKLTICNYDNYQGEDKPKGKPRAQKRHSEGTERATTKESKEDKEVYRAFKHLSIKHTEVDKLVGEGWTRAQIDTILDNIENYKKNTQYNSLVLTARNWLKKDYPISQTKKSWRDGLSDAEKATFI